MNLLTATSAFLALAAHVLIAAAIATNYWLVYTPIPSVTANVPLNPLYNDTGLSDRSVRYRVHHLGIWVACHEELDFGGKQSCGFIDRKCTSKVCWKKSNEDGTIAKNELTCKRNPVAALTGRCAAFQATRGIAVIATFTSILAVVLLFVALCVMSRLFAAAGSIVALFTAILGMITFAVYLGGVVNAQNLTAKVGKPGYSYILLVSSWVVEFVAVGLAYLGAFASVSHSEDSADYESN